MSCFIESSNKPYNFAADNSNGLDLNDKIGIGIGVPSCIAALIGIYTACYQLYKWKKKRDGKAEGSV